MLGCDNLCKSEWRSCYFEADASSRVEYKESRLYYDQRFCGRKARIDHDSRKIHGRDDSTGPRQIRLSHLVHHGRHDPRERHGHHRRFEASQLGHCREVYRRHFGCPCRRDSRYDEAPHHVEARQTFDDRIPCYHDEERAIVFGPHSDAEKEIVVYHSRRRGRKELGGSRRSHAEGVCRRIYPGRLDQSGIRGLMGDRW